MVGGGKLVRANGYWMWEEVNFGFGCLMADGGWWRMDGRGWMVTSQMVDKRRRMVHGD